MTIRFLLFFAVLSFSFAPISAHASWVDFFFPMLKDESQDPKNTLQAPFVVKTDKELAKEAENTAEGELVEEVKPPNPQNAIPMERPHRATAVLSEWIVNTASEIMTFDDPNVVQTLKLSEPYFEKKGRQQYLAFLEKNNIRKVLSSKKYKVRSYVNDAPLLLNEGPVAGRYRWLYEVPLMVSYMKRDVSDYKDAEPVNQQVVLRIQIGRSPDAQTDMGVYIERLSGEAQSMDKK